MSPVFATAQTPAAPAAQPTPAAAPEPGASKKSLVEELDAVWARRGTPATDRENEKKVQEAVAAEPENFEILWRAARWKVWVSDGATDPKEKARVGKEGWELGDRARAAKPNDAHGHYFAGASVGIYSQGIGILNALGQGIEAKFNERLDRAIQLDPTIDIGGPWMTKGRYWYELPWPMRDLKKSRELLEKATTRFPQNLRAHLYLAETLLRDGKTQEAKAAFSRAMNGDGSHDPPEARRVRSMGKRVEAEFAKAD